MIQDFVTPKKRVKKNVAANLSEDEYQSVQAVIQWRKAQDLSKDQADFLRQLLHFVINKEYLDGYDFLLPDINTIHQIKNSIQHDTSGNPAAAN